MRATFPRTLTLAPPRVGTLRLSLDSALSKIALMAIVALAAALRFTDIEALGYANHYYSAAVASMLQSWQNFFFVAAEPGGSVSVDKPPVGLWLQTISARFLGVNGFAVLLPEILAGILSVIVVNHLVRRSFGTVPGLLAALALAITPVAVAVDRNNTIDSILILTLLLAAWAFIKATESGKLRFLLLGATLVGVGFNVKMLEAFLPLPAFYALYFFGARLPMRRKLPYLALATTLLLAMSLSWATIVDLTPASQRPYVGSSSDNSELSLIVGYNGMQRLLGMRGGFLGGIVGNNQNGGPRGGNAVRRPPGANAAPQQPRPNGALPPPGPGAPAGFPNGFGGPPGVGAGGPAGGFGGFGGFAGGFGGTGRPGVLRLLTSPLSKEASWLLPLGLCGMALLAFRARLRWPLGDKHQALLLWGGWLVTTGIFFSIAGFFHEYYLVTFAAPLAALVGIAVGELWRFRRHHNWLAIALLLAVAAATLALQINTARAFVQNIWWLPIALGLAATGAVISIAATTRLIPPAAFAVLYSSWQRLARRPSGLAPSPILSKIRYVSAIGGFALVVAALLITPAIWSGLTTLSASANQSLPAAYSGGRESGPANAGGLRIDQALLDYLQPRTQQTEYLMAVPSSMQGADYVLATGRPVLYLGGFMGQDHVVSADDLARLVAAGKLRYIYWNSNTRGGFGGQSDISTWIANNCTPVPGFDTATRNAGAPDGTATGPAGGRPVGRGDMAVALYSCGGGTP